MTDGTGLAGYAAAAYTANDVKLLSGVGDGQRLTHDQFQGLQTKVIINISVVDGDLAGTCINAYTSNRFFSAAGAVEIRIRFVHNSDTSLTYSKLPASGPRACGLRL